MGRKIYSVITATGKYIPTKTVKNSDFITNTFYESNGEKIDKDPTIIVDKFQEITTIAERKYVTDNMVTSDIAYEAAKDALLSSETNKETLDYLIVAHNFGDISTENRQLDIVPSLASRVKQKLGIENPNCIAYDITFGCPGWLQAIIQADYFIRSGDAKKIMVIGADVLSRIADPYDRDSMIYADGAGATILEGKESETPIGILTHSTRSDTLEYANMLYMGKSFNETKENSDHLYLKMNGRKLYMYALDKVPTAIKECLDKCNTHIKDIKKILIHQANGKMDEAILSRLYKLFDISILPENIMPMSISWLGNSSVATIPTLLDLIIKGQLNPHTIQKGDTMVFASVGAGMNINAMIYKN